MSHRLPRSLVLLVAAAAILGVACEPSMSPEPTVVKSETQTRISPTAMPAASATPTATATPSPTSAATPSGTPGPRVKISANTSTVAELEAALRANGVPDPAKWAREVVATRPYPAEDANLTRLRQHLAELSAPPGVVEDIVTALKP